MSKDISGTRFFGVDVSGDPKNLLPSVLQDARNIAFRQQGDNPRRNGVRLATTATFLTNDAPGVAAVLGDNKRVKYVRMVAGDRRTYDVFACENRVYFFDEGLARFLPIYEAPGTADVDVVSYLGYLLVVSQSSNIAILKPYARAAYLLSKTGAKIIRGQGTITGSTVDFVAEDQYDQAGLEDFTIDQGQLYALHKTSIGTQTVVPSSGDIDELQNIVWDAASRYRLPLSVKVGATLAGSEETEPKTNPIELVGVPNSALTVNSSTISYGAAADFPDNLKTYQVKVERYWAITNARPTGTGNGVEGFQLSGSDLTGGTARFNGNIAKFGTLSQLPARMGNWTRAYYYANGLNVVKTRQNTFGYSYGNVEIFNTGNPSIVIYNYDGNGANSKIWIYENNGTVSELNNFHVTYEADNFYSKNIVGNHWDPKDIDDGLHGTPGTQGDELIVYRRGGNASWAEYQGRSGIPFAFDAERTWKVYRGGTYWSKHTDPTDESLTVAFGSSSVSLNVSFSEAGFSATPSLSNADIDAIYRVGGAADRQLDMSAEFTLNVRPLIPYFRVSSSVKGQDSNIPITNASGYPCFNKTGIVYENANIPFQKIKFTFDIAALPAPTLTETSYALTPASTGANLYGAYVKVLNKDAFTVRSTLCELRLENPSVLKVAKLNDLFLLIKDDTNTFFLGVRKVAGVDLYFAQVDLASYGTVREVKVLSIHNGERLLALVTTTGLYLWRQTGDALELAASWTGTYGTAILDVAEVKATEDQTDIFCVQDATTNTTFALRLIDSGDGVAFSSSSPITGSANQFRVNYAGANRPKTLAFFEDDQGVLRITADDTAGTPTDVNRFLEYTVAGGTIGSTWVKILSDRNLTAIQQIRPVTTPPKPDVSTASAANNRTGRYQYFWVAREYDAAGALLYESVPSEPSVVAAPSAKTVTVSWPTGAAYTPNSTSPASVKLKLFRVELLGTEVRLKSTDFLELTESSALTLTGSTYSLASGIVDVWNDSTYSGGTAITGKESYRGYSTFYPRCRFIAVVGNVIYQANDAKFRNNIYQSDLLDPTQWRPQNTLAAGLFTNDEITALVENGVLYVATRDSWSIIQGVGTSTSVQTPIKTVGCTDHRTNAVANGWIYCLSESGFYRVQGYKHEKIDWPVKRITEQFVYNTAVVAYFDPFSQEYRIIYDLNKVAAYSIPRNQWSIHEYPYDRIIYGFVRENPTTDLPDRIMLVRGSEKGVSVYRMLVEDQYTVYDYQEGQGSESTTAVVPSYLTTKAMDVDAPMNEKVWRRVHLDVLRSHGITAEVSIDGKRFVPMIEQKKRDYFNGVPKAWYRFGEIYGNLCVDSGRRGWVAKLIGSGERNADGMIDRALRLTGGYVNVGDLPKMPGGATVCFWAKPEQGSETAPVVFSDFVAGDDSNLPTLGADDRAILVGTDIAGWLHADARICDFGAPWGTGPEYRSQWDPDANVAFEFLTATGITGSLRYFKSGGTAYSEVGASPNGVYSVISPVNQVGYGPGNPQVGNGLVDLGYYTSARAEYTGDFWADPAYWGAYDTTFETPTTGGWAGTSAPGMFPAICPVWASNDDVKFCIGKGVWKANGSAGSSCPWFGVSRFAGQGSDLSTYGIHPDTFLADGSGVRIKTTGLWSTFPALGDGTKTWEFPLFDATDNITGSISFRYKKSAWEAAFKNTNKDIVVAKSGAIFIGSISPENLVVTSAGVDGPAVAVAGQNGLSIYMNHAAGSVYDAAVRVKMRGDTNPVVRLNLLEKAGQTEFDTWKHVAVVIDPAGTGKASLYVNGALVDSDDLAGAFIPFDGIRDCIIGRLADVTYANTIFRGSIDDFRVYDSALSAQDVEDIYLFGTGKLDFDKRVFVPPQGHHKGKTAAFRFSSDDYMNVRTMTVMFRKAGMR